jgi:V/A-type H+-transporting ATPase subunit K
MIKNRLANAVLGSTFLLTMMAPAMALAQETTTTTEDYRVGVAKAIAAGASMAVSAISAGYAQSRIGSAGAGTLAERPEVGTTIIILQALPEMIVLLGFVIAFMIGV